ncbi:MAG: hypothetical protein Q9183_004950 [Haloplaca sp. 2 TL-2023]
MAPLSERNENGAQVKKAESHANSTEQTRHIPWPDIFKHHISIIEGHLRMIEMVRKHTEQGSENHHTICDMIDRTKEMLQQSKISERSKDGSQSSPGQMRRRHSGSARAKLSTDSGQLKGLEQPTERERTEAVDGHTVPEGPMFYTDTNPTPVRGIPTNAPPLKRPSKPSKPIEPTTSADPDAATVNSSSSPLKRKASDASTSSTHNDKKFKQAPPTLKRKASSDSIDPSRKKYSADPSSNSAIIIDPTTTHGETEDITHIVDARMAAREERRRLKKADRKGEKRKRESDASALDQAPDGEGIDAAAVPEKQKGPEQKRIKPTKETRKEKKRKRESEGSAAPGAGVGDITPTAIKEPKVKNPGNKTNTNSRKERGLANTDQQEPEKPKKKKAKITDNETAKKHALPTNSADPEDKPKKKKAKFSSPTDEVDQRTKKHGVDDAHADEVKFADEQVQGEPQNKKKRSKNI